MVDMQIILNKVLLVSTRDKAYIGMPVVTNAAVHAVVEEQVCPVYCGINCEYTKRADTGFSQLFVTQGLDDKVIIFKFKKKKKYQRKAGHRQVIISTCCPRGRWKYFLSSHKN